MRLDHRVRQALDLVPTGARLLDLGAGDGYVTARLGVAAGATLAVSVDVGAPAPPASRDRPVSQVTVRLPAPREGRFSRWQAVRSDRRPRPLDLALRAGFAVYDLVPFRKDVMVVRATGTDAA